MSKASQILRFLPDNAYQAATLANAPSASNVYATMQDISTFGPAGIDIKLNGTVVQAASYGINFTGNVNVSNAGGPNAEVTVNITGGGSSPWQVNGNDVYYNTGNVGIGDFSSSAPGAELHIKGSGIQEAIIESPDNNASLKLISADSNNSYIDFEETSGDRWIMGGVGGSSDTFMWSSGNAFTTSQRFAMVRPGGVSTAAPEFRMYEGDPAGGGTPNNFVGLKAPAVMVNNVSLTLPGELGDVGAVLTQTNAQGATALSNDVVVTGQVVGGTDLTNVFTANACEIDCDNGMAQVVDGDALTGTGALTFTNQKEGATYAIIFIQGSGTHNVTLPSSSYWVSASAFDFSTLADDERALITATYLGSVWTLAVKELTLI